MVKTGQPGLAVVAVADALSAAVIPSLIPPGKAEAARWQAPAAPMRRPPLPLIKLTERRKGTAVYGLTTLGHNGRLADNKVFGALGWVADVRLDIRQSANLILVAADEHGLFGLDKLGRFHLPAAARNFCRLHTGDRLLLAAYPDGGLLVVHAPAALDEVVERVYAEALEGESR
ncbi:hypothetical protein ACIA5C_20980 [Actinoplanes sp. NPDC051343]|uniref:hypothetical protein n=1 Tax=Actinoplanes sp. NPDC051343 TaxID=3363906 RepID=UPI0037ABD18B